MFKKSSQEWETVWLQPSNVCEYYAACGPNAVCTVGQDGKAQCTCLKGLSLNKIKNPNIFFDNMLDTVCSHNRFVVSYFEGVENRPSSGTRELCSNPEKLHFFLEISCINTLVPSRLKGS
jgi:hypothetical protein